MKRILLIVAHLDDETFGMGGTLTNLCLSNNYEVKVVSLCQGRNEENAIERKSAFKNIAENLGFEFKIYNFFDLELEMVLLKRITEIINNEINLFKPDTIFTVSEDDIHQDHKIVSHATKIACRPNRSNIKELYEFKIPGCEPFSKTYYDTVYNIGDTHLIKQNLIDEYASENKMPAARKEYFRTIYRELEL